MVTPWIRARAQRAGEQPGGLGAGRRPGDHLGQHRVVVHADHGAVVDTGVQPQAGAGSGPNSARRPARRSGAACRSAAASACAGSSAYRRTSMACPRSGGGRGDGSGPPSATTQLQPTRSTPVTHSVTGCSTCSRVFISRKKNSPGRARAGTRPCRRRHSRPPGRRDRRLRTAVRAAAASTGRRRRLLDDLLVPALDRALPLAQRHDVAVRVGQDLDLDVAGALDVPLAEDRRRRRTPTRPRAGPPRPPRPSSSRSRDDAHPPAAAAGRRLDQHRERRSTSLGLGPRSAASARRPSAISAFASSLSPSPRSPSAAGRPRSARRR